MLDLRGKAVVTAAAATVVAAVVAVSAAAERGREALEEFVEKGLKELPRVLHDLHTARERTVRQRWRTV